ncbi:DUF4331 family protein [Reichenbachiella agariperforans]|uniref:DUF4331 family protein n=1 Tax=Reichenbachiella agariperforans TaxID=156994 RepID=UPI001C093E46|nr:DUF4331 family protein [Reichenbachiella agariperforans]MBU2913436.1 DUF4331 domain-containing protein [Reichenbachiella agariperforans]
MINQNDLIARQKVKSLLSKRCMPYSQIECLVIQYCSLESGSTVSDITDYCAFECPADADSYVFVCHVAGLTAPGTTPSFDDDVMYEVNIDSDADNVEDQVI